MTGAVFVGTRGRTREAQSLLTTRVSQDLEIQARGNGTTSAWNLQSRAVKQANKELAFIAFVCVVNLDESCWSYLLKFGRNSGFVVAAPRGDTFYFQFLHTLESLDSILGDINKSMYLMA